ncbi:MAG: DNA-binding response regulator [Spirochaetaceae bacterium]|nr:MAG: DNA-binding response regulator [Spirochaetaceae bacterium]
MSHIFVVEDNTLIREGIRDYLAIEGDQVTEFDSVAGVLEGVRTRSPDLLILDIMLPDGNGLRLAKDIREFSDVPILFLTAKDTESDRITGFEVGGDDYVVKPFSPKELVLRTRALLRRTAESKPEHARHNAFVCDGRTLRLDDTTHKDYLDDEELHLTISERRILRRLSEEPGRVVSRERILGDCLDYIHDGSHRTVDTHIANLRAKLDSGDWIETVRGVGYRFRGAPA